MRFIVVLAVLVAGCQEPRAVKDLTPDPDAIDGTDIVEAISSFRSLHIVAAQASTRVCSSGMVADPMACLKRYETALSALQDKENTVLLRILRMPVKDKDTIKDILDYHRAMLATAVKAILDDYKAVLIARGIGSAH